MWISIYLQKSWRGWRKRCLILNLHDSLMDNERYLPNRHSEETKRLNDDITTGALTSHGIIRRSHSWSRRGFSRTLHLSFTLINEGNHLVGLLLRMFPAKHFKTSSNHHPFRKEKSLFTYTNQLTYQSSF